jgi:hypothetical protein
MPPLMRRHRVLILRTKPLRVLALRVSPDFRRRSKMTQSIADILERAADLIEPEGRWIQGEYARTADGSWAAPSDSTAACWCVLGAIKRVGRFRADADAAEVLRALQCVIPTSGYIHEWNDASTRKQVEVVATLREAARLASVDGSPKGQDGEAGLIGEADDSAVTAKQADAGTSS